ncbi:hypothetical protein [Pantoea sp. Mhis]
MAYLKAVFKAGKLVDLALVSLFDKGVAVKHINIETFRLCQR